MKEPDPESIAEANRINDELEKLHKEIRSDHFIFLQDNPVVKLARIYMEMDIADYEIDRDNPLLPTEWRTDRIGRICGARAFMKKMDTIKSGMESYWEQERRKKAEQPTNEGDE